MAEETQSVGNGAIEPDADAIRRRGMLFIALAVACVGFAMALQLGLNANFVVEEIDLDPWQVGKLEGARETCGIVALAIIALLAGLAEPLIGAGMLVLLGAGLSCYFFVQDYLWLVLASVVWSQGLHVWMPLPNSMTLSLAEPGRWGHRLGQVHAAGSVGHGIGFAVALALITAGMAIRPLYLVAGAAAVLGAAACMAIPRRTKTHGPRLVFKRRYSLFYLLSFLDGWRKQIFICFAGYLLVRKYDTDVRVILLLWGATQVINYFSAPRVGRLIDRIGERKVLVFYFACLTVFFACYATIRNVYVLYGVFVADNAFFVLAMALRTYVNRIAPKNELTPTLSMGVAMNHVAAVAMPLAGGFLWESLGYEWTFLIGAIAAVLSIFVALRVPQRGPGRMALRAEEAPAG